MTTGFWFTIYLIGSFIGIAASMMKSTRDHNTNDNTVFIVIAGIYGLLMSGMIILTYYAGVFKYITGYEGNAGAFGAYVLLILVAYGIMVFKNWYGIFLVGWSVFMLWAIDGLTQFYILFN